MAATLKDVAILANVSITTASHALNGKPVNNETRKRVLEAAKKLNYHKSMIGRNLITNKSNTIGMVILNSKKSRDMTEEISYYYKMLTGALKSIQQHGYLFNFEVQYWEDVVANQFIEKKVLSRSVDGMILVPQFAYSYDFISTLEKESFPYVIINPHTEIKAESSVRIDNYLGGSLAAEHLLSLGHRDIVFINGPENHIDSISREKGFLTTLLKHGVPFNIDRMIYSDFTNEGGYTAMKEILSGKRYSPTAVFAANDYMAAGAMHAIYEAGLKIPADISIVGYDDIDVARTVYPRLTTLKSPVKEMGFSSAERVFAMINRKQPSYEELVIRPTLVERQTTRKL